MIRINKAWVRSSFVMFALAFAAEQATGYSINPAYKYIFFLTTCLLCTLILALAPRDKPIVWNVLLHQGACAVVFILVSLIALYLNGFRLYPDFSRDLFRLMGPAAMAFLLYNADHGEGCMDFYFNAFFITETVEYLLVDVLPILSLETLMSISLDTSFSPFESTRASRFTMLLIYYVIRGKKLPAALAFLLNLLTFKRFNMLFAVLFFPLGWILRRTARRVPNWLVNLTAAGFCLAPVILLFFTSNLFVGWFESTFNKDFNLFTMGRFEQIRYIFNYDKPLLGLGSTKELLSVRAARGVYSDYLHSDLLRFHVETSIFGLIAYVFGTLNPVKLRGSYFTYAATTFLLILMLITPNFGDFPPYLFLFMMCQIDFNNTEKVCTR